MTAADYRLALTIRTASRAPGPDYLHGTLESLRRSGSLRSGQLQGLSISDGGRDAPRHAMRAARTLPASAVVAGDHRLTPNGNAAMALRLAVADAAPWVLFMEDDVQVCDRFVDGVSAWLSRHDRSGHRLFTFGCSHKALPLAAVRGHEAVAIPVKDFYGTACYALRRADAEHLAGWQLRNLTYNGTTRSHDLLLRRWLAETHPKGPREVLASVPCMVQHVGDVSLLSPGRTRTLSYPTWPGPDWRYGKEGLWATSPS